MGDGFIARDINFQKTAGPQYYQAVALRSGSYQSVFYRWAFLGYQDTFCPVTTTIFQTMLHLQHNRHHFWKRRSCLPKQEGHFMDRTMITAQGRGAPNQNTGISIHNSGVIAAPDLNRCVIHSGHTWGGHGSNTRRLYSSEHFWLFE